MWGFVSHTALKYSSKSNWKAFVQQCFLRLYMCTCYRVLLQKIMFNSSSDCKYFLWFMQPGTAALKERNTSRA